VGNTLELLNQNQNTMKTTQSFKPLRLFSILLFLILSSCGDKVAELNKLLPDLNDKFSFLNLDKGDLSKVDAPKPRIYIISILTKDKVSFPFEKQKYYFPKNTVGGGKDKVKELLAQVCNLIDSTYSKNDKVFDILRGSKTKVSFEEAGFKIEQEINTGDFLAEIATLLKHLHDFEFKKLRIYVKGYADYSPNPWWDIQQEENGIYRSINVHPAIKTGNQMLFYRDVLEERVAKSDTIRNPDLPNLRAAYLKEILDEMVSRYIKRKKLYSDWSVEILDGSEVGYTPDPSQRRGEIVVEIYD
jgi:hypothetical protein